jgi:hypothetical protein
MITHPTRAFDPSYSLISYGSTALRTVNAKLRKIVTEKIPSKASEILQKCTTEGEYLI